MSRMNKKQKNEYIKAVEERIDAELEQELIEKELEAWANEELDDLKKGTSIVIGKPLKRYRVLIQERKSKTCKTEGMRSFMVYDYTGQSSIDKLKGKLSDRALRYANEIND